ncbi:MAG: DNA cytosine methyltransferase [Balneolaceae bacterium]
MAIPVIDLFAGPGGLGEGFSSVFDENGHRVFKNVLSVEMEKFAHQTLTLRSFYRQFSPDEVPDEYYELLRNNLTEEELYQLYPEESQAAKNESKNWKLGYDNDSVSNTELDQTIVERLNGENEWILTGGPPCQAYSVVGRSRLQRKTLDGRKDERVNLYKHYLRIIKKHRPSVFIMENVKGMLSARSKTHSVFKRIMMDLKSPGYRVFSLVRPPRNDLFEGSEYEPEDFVIRAEEFGIPQARHRVILVGIREDFYRQPPDLLSKIGPVPISEIISDLPRIRSSLSKSIDTWENWKAVLDSFLINGALTHIDTKVRLEIETAISKLRKPKKGSGDNFVKKTLNQKNLAFEANWFIDKRIGGFCNHHSRGHMDSDLLRYLFVSSFGKIHKKSPKLEDFPEQLLPAHRNVQDGIKKKKFADRFRVQLYDSPAKTITSHISKDGHYYIHPDPTQCRSLTVREAARIQTFPDNYYFCGPRTAQYIQVGNAVPPLLANRIAKITADLFNL